MAIVLHPFMLDWLGDENLMARLDRLAAAAAWDELGARCADLAEHVTRRARAIRGRHRYRPRQLGRLSRPRRTGRG